MKVKVLFFASAKEITGLSTTTVELDAGANTTDLETKLSEMFPSLDIGRDQISLAVNQVYCRQPIDLKDGDEVALLPPISGG